MVEEILGKLEKAALELGASDVTVIDPRTIVVEDRFPELCRPPQCDAFGTCANCPPHVMTPSDFRKRLKSHSAALVFKVDVPTEILMTEEREHISRLVQEIAAGLERAAREEGLDDAWGLGFGSCRKIFCSGRSTCNVLDGGTCRNPDRARPSLSGLGVNFNRLNNLLGWDATRTAEHSGLTDTPMSMVTGILLV
jgi:predicted metal-binding protein